MLFDHENDNLMVHAIEVYGHGENIKKFETFIRLKQEHYESKVEEVHLNGLELTDADVGDLRTHLSNTVVS